MDTIETPQRWNRMRPVSPVRRLEVFASSPDTTAWLVLERDWKRAEAERRREIRRLSPKTPDCGG